MSRLLDELRDAAQARRLINTSAPLGFAEAAALIRDMPYQRASDRRPETIVREWRGTCSGKHYLLEALAAEFDIPAQLYHCTHHFTPENTRHFPADLRRRIPEAGLPDVHTFLRVRVQDRWVIVDITWPARLAEAGFAVNAAWDGVTDTIVAAEVEEEYPVRGDPQQMKTRLIAAHCGDRAEERERFIVALSDWLAVVTAP